MGFAQALEPVAQLQEQLAVQDGSELGCAH
jgi:hypothetical protein